MKRRKVMTTDDLVKVAEAELQKICSQNDDKSCSLVHCFSKGAQALITRQNVDLNDTDEDEPDDDDPNYKYAPKSVYVSSGKIIGITINHLTGYRCHNPNLAEEIEISIFFSQPLKNNKNQFKWTKETGWINWLEQPLVGFHITLV